MLHLVTFGGLALHSVNEAVAPRLSAQRLAILAVLAAEGDRRVSRERLTGLFWPDADEERARHCLRQALYSLRNEIGYEVVRSDFALSLDPQAIGSDVADFRYALLAGDRAAAAKAVRGPFLAGFYLPAAATFQRWVEEERARLHTAATSAISVLATEATAANDVDTAIGWWRQLTQLDPLSSRFALGYLKALAARGDRVAALDFARQHAVLVRRELETEPDAEILRLEAALRSMPSAAALAARPAPAAEATPAASTWAAGTTEATGLGSSPVLAPPAARHRRRLTRIALAASGVAAVAIIAVAVARRATGDARAAGTPPTLAVGLIRDDALDSVRIGGMLADMLSTNLASIRGLQVIANSRVLGLIPAGQDTSASAYLEAARRAGATELLEGRLLDRSGSVFTIEMRRVDLRNGLLKGAYRASATTRFRLVDSVTAMVARSQQLTTRDAVAPDVTTRSASAYRLYQEALRAYHAFDYPAAQRLFRAALEDDSTFAMAAYYDALLKAGEQKREPLVRALRLAQRASERERLLITVHLLSRLEQSPGAVQVAETLAARYPNDARAMAAVAGVKSVTGDWAGAARQLERALAIDSVPLDPKAPCYRCEALTALNAVYWLWDSLPAAARTAQSFVRLHRDWPQAWELMFWSAAKRGDSAGTAQAFRRYTALLPVPRAIQHEVRLNLMLDQYEHVERDLRPLLESSRLDDAGPARWYFLIALRNQGRLREARVLNETGRLPGLEPPLAAPRVPDEITDAVLALERGDASAGAAVFAKRHQRIDPRRFFAPGFAARNVAWSGTLLGMALAATGDTAAVRRMADTVEYWGQRSLYGRDRKAHHYLRGMVLVAAGRDDDAIAHFRQAIYSYTLGFTRVNFELGRALLRRGRAREAAHVVAPALRGEVDASNLYVTRTELHELLAQAYDMAGHADSAAVHYRTVVRSWTNADELFRARRETARRWLVRYDRTR